VATLAEDLCGASLENALVHLEWQDQHTQRVARLAPRARLLITRMGGFLARTLKVFTQNRARQKRSFGKAYADWADMLDESTIVDEAVSHVLPLTVYPPYALGALAQYVLLLQAEQAIGAGFDLALYHTREHASMYWVLGQVQGEQHALARKLLTLTTGPCSPALRSYAHLSLALHKLSTAYAWMHAWLGAAALPASQEEDDTAAAVFFRRLKWLRRPPWLPRARLRVVTEIADSVEPIGALWAEWRRCLAAVRDENALEKVASACKESLAALEGLRALRDGDTWIALCRTRTRHLDAGLAQACHDLLDVAISAPSPVHVTWSAAQHAWYPAANQSS